MKDNYFLYARIDGRLYLLNDQLMIVENGATACTLSSIDEVTKNCSSEHQLMSVIMIKNNIEISNDYIRYESYYGPKHIVGIINADDTSDLIRIVYANDYPRRMPPARASSADQLNASEKLRMRNTIKEVIE